MINEVAAAFTAAIESGRLDLPLPGGGRTWERWASLAELAGAGWPKSFSVERILEEGRLPTTRSGVEVRKRGHGDEGS
jgi:hypothetical protein